MADTCWESVKAEGSAALDKLKDLLHEGNVRRVRVRQGVRVIAEFPLTAGGVGAVFAPGFAGVVCARGLALVVAIVAIGKDCTIEIERPLQDVSAGATAAPEARAV